MASRPSVSRAERDVHDAAGAPLPLLRRFPALAAVPRVALGEFPSPVVRVHGLTPGDTLWIKRDDLDAPEFGGNKVRALEFLLGGLVPGDEVITLGGEGSTHVLATAAFARRLGARVTAVRWRHDMNPAARAVAARAQALCTRVRTTSGSSTAFLAALFARRRGTRWVPPGGTSPLGMLGHVNAALELAEQVEAGELPVPAHVVVPLGSGGTAAGLALGFTLAGLDTVVVAARVAPWIVAHHRRVIALARTCAAFIERRIGAPLPRLDGRQVRVVHDVYGGAYGRVLASARASAALLEQASSIRLDDTYSAKAFAAALALARASDGVTLFWLTFDARTISAREGGT